MILQETIRLALKHLRSFSAVTNKFSGEAFVGLLSLLRNERPHNEHYPHFSAVFCVCVARAFYWEKRNNESEYFSGETKALGTKA